MLDGITYSLDPFRLAGAAGGGNRPARLGSGLPQGRHQRAAADGQRARPGGVPLLDVLKGAPRCCSPKALLQPAPDQRQQRCGWSPLGLARLAAPSGRSWLGCKGGKAVATAWGPCCSLVPGRGSGLLRLFLGQPDGQPIVCALRAWSTRRALEPAARFAPQGSLLMHRRNRPAGPPIWPWPCSPPCLVVWRHAAPTLGRALIAANTRQTDRAGANPRAVPAQQTTQPSAEGPAALVVPAAAQHLRLDQGERSTACSRRLRPRDRGAAGLGHHVLEAGPGCSCCCCKAAAPSGASSAARLQKTGARASPAATRHPPALRSHRRRAPARRGLGRARVAIAGFAPAAPNTLADRRKPRPQLITLLRLHPPHPRPGRLMPGAPGMGLLGTARKPPGSGERPCSSWRRVKPDRDRVREPNQQGGFDPPRKRGSGGNPAYCWGLTASSTTAFCLRQRPGNRWPDSHRVRPAGARALASLATHGLDRPAATAPCSSSGNQQRTGPCGPDANHTKTQSPSGRITPGSAARPAPRSFGQTRSGLGAATESARRRSFGGHEWWARKGSSPEPW